VRLNAEWLIPLIKGMQLAGLLSWIVTLIAYVGILWTLWRLQMEPGHRDFALGLTIKAVGALAAQLDINWQNFVDLATGHGPDAMNYARAAIRLFYATCLLVGLAIILRSWLNGIFGPSGVWMWCLGMAVIVTGAAWAFQA
jgi:hypothetical protein